MQLEELANILVDWEERMEYVILHKDIEIRKNTWYNITMIRKGDTKDANDTERDD